MTVAVSLFLWMQPNMKLSDYAKKTPAPPRPSRQVFNVNNDKQEQKFTAKIAELQKEIDRLAEFPIKVESLTKEVESYREQVTTLAESLREASKTVTSTQRLYEKQKTEADNLKQIEQQHKEVIRERNAKQSLLDQATTHLDNLIKEHTHVKEELQARHNEFTALSERELVLRDEAPRLKEQINQLTGKNNGLERKNAQIITKNALLTRENVEFKLKSQRLEIDIKSAKQTILELNYVKTQLSGWSNQLNKDYSQETSKKSALEKKIVEREEVIASLSEHVTELLESREELAAIVQYYKKELMRQRPNSANGFLIEAQMPFASEIVKRQYIGHGKPTLLKFKLKEEANDNLTV